jgi:hypothetical protein
MYIACNNCTQRGYFLGDMLTVIKAAWMFVENEPHDHVVLSLHDREPLNFLWDRFIAENCVTVVHDRWHQGNRDVQYAAFGERLTSRMVKGIAFDTYKELYPRLDGGARQHILCGRENGLGRKNIFAYYYFGQQNWREEPRGEDDFGPGVIDIPSRTPLATDTAQTTRRSVFIAPHEKCHGNAVFTHAFWQEVVEGLLRVGLHVMLNDDRGFLRELEGPLLSRSYLSYRELVAQVAGQRLVLAGNSGVGWLAGAVGAPLIALERNQLLVEYSFSLCGLRSLISVIDEPDAERVVEAAHRYLEHAP